MANVKRVTPGREGYKILFNENTVIMNHKFAAAAAKYGTTENKLMKSIREDFPGMAEVIVSGREQTTAKTNSRLTYENMEKHIQAYDNAAELLDFRPRSAAVPTILKNCDSWLSVSEPPSSSPRVRKNICLRQSKICAATIRLKSFRTKCTLWAETKPRTSTSWLPC